MTEEELNQELARLRSSLSAAEYITAAAKLQEDYAASSYTNVGKTAGETVGGILSLTSAADQATDLISNGAGLLTSSLKAVKLPSFDVISLPGGANLSTTLEGMIGAKVEGGFAHSLLTNGSPESYLSSMPEISNKLGAFDNIAEIFGDAVEVLAIADPNRYSALLAFTDGIKMEVDVDSFIDDIKDISALAAPLALIDQAKETAANFANRLGKAYDAAADNVAGSVSPLIDSLVNKLNNSTGLSVFNEGNFSLSSQFQGIGLFGSVSELLASSSSKAAALTTFFKASSNFSNDMAGAKEKGMTSILQNIVESNDGNIKRTVKDIAPNLSEEKLASAEKSIIVGDKQEAAKTISEGSDLTVEQAYNVVDKLNPTLSGTVLVKFSEALPPPYIIGQDMSTWSGDADGFAFEYVSSVEELEAEFRSSKREITETIVHWTDTYTNKNLSAEQIHDIHRALGDDGISYHFIIRRDGSLQRGRPIDIVGAHTTTNKHDNYSIGIAFVGGYNCPSGTENPENFKSAQSLTIGQFKTFDLFCKAFYKMYPGGQILGHNDIDPNQFDPGFDVIDYCQRKYGKVSSYEDPAAEFPISAEESNKEGRIAIALARANEFNAFPYEANDIDPPDSISNLPSNIGTEPVRTEDEGRTLPGTGTTTGGGGGSTNNGGGAGTTPSVGNLFNENNVSAGSFDLFNLATATLSMTAFINSATFRTFKTTGNSTNSASGYAGYFSFEIPQEYRQGYDVSMSMHRMPSGDLIKNVTSTIEDKSPKLYWEQVSRNGSSGVKSDGTIQILEGGSSYALAVKIISKPNDEVSKTNNHAKYGATNSQYRDYRGYCIETNISIDWEDIVVGGSNNQSIPDTNLRAMWLAGYSFGSYSSLYETAKTKFGIETYGKSKGKYNDIPIEGSPTNASEFDLKITQWNNGKPNGDNLEISNDGVDYNLPSDDLVVGGSGASFRKDPETGSYTNELAQNNRD